MRWLIYNFGKGMVASHRSSDNTFSIFVGSLDLMDTIAIRLYDDERGAILVQRYSNKWGFQERDGSVWTQEWYKYERMPFLRFADGVLQIDEPVSCEYTVRSSRVLGFLS